ncbi:MAG TPA: radical SAM protein, partial [Leucothrix sp.]|nr:radical SAM protein [Leucothrix sp.]
KLYFGNINEKEFDEIWKSKDYREFRRIFEKRINAYFFDFPELPDVCKSCYKAYSI